MFAFLALLAVGACSEVNVTAVDIAEIEVEPASLQLVVGDTGRLVANAKDVEGNPLTGRPVQWSSSNTSVAQVMQDGRVIGAGVGDATITAASNGVAGQATVRINGAAAIGVDPTSVSFRMTQGQAAPGAQTVAVRNDGQSVLNGLSASIAYAQGERTGWLETSLAQTQAPTTLTLRVIDASLPPGLYHATVTLASSTPRTGTRDITVVFEILVPTPSPTIVLGSHDVQFIGVESGSDPSPRMIEVRNGGGGALAGLNASVTYTPGQPTGWLVANLDAATAPTTLTLAPRVGPLRAGIYNATVSITGQASNSPQSIAVRFEVGVAPSIGLSSTAITFAADSGAADPPAQTVNVFNSGGGTMSGMTVSVRYAAGQSTGWLVASLSSSTAPSTLTLNAKTGSLGVGKYEAFADVYAQGAPNSPRTINITFTVNPRTAPSSIALSATSASFSATVGGANPAAQTVNVTNAGGGTLSGLATAVTYASGQPTGWLTASLSTTTAPATLTLQPATGSLAAGTYNATVAVSATNAANSPQSIAVTFTVNAPAPSPNIALSATSASFNATAGGANPAAQTIDITNSGGGTLNGLTAPVTYASGQPTGWLAATLSGATAPATLTLQPATGSLPAGTYNATVAVTASNAANSPQNITVTFTVNAAPPPPSIALSASSASFNATAGGANPAAQTIDITNSGGGTLNGLTAPVTYASGQPTGWLAATLSGATAPATLTLQPATGSLPAGTYNATVAVTASNAANSPQNITVTFTVNAAPPPPSIALSASSASFNATVGGANPAAQTIDVTNSGGGTLSGLTAPVTYASGQPTGWLAATLNGATAPASLTLQPSTGSLPAGTYNATVAVTSSNAANSPQNITVTFTVAQPPPSPAILVAPATVTFNATAGGANPASQNVDVTNSGGGTLDQLAVNVTYASGQATGWLAATLNGTTAPTTITLQATTGTLTAATYNATVQVNSAAAANSPQSIAVTFTVASPPAPASIALVPAIGSFTAAEGGPNPAAQNISVTNSGSGTLSNLAANISYAAGQPTGWLTATLAATTAPTTLSLQPTTGSLTAGAYEAIVAVSSIVANNSPQNVNVTFTISSSAPAAPTDFEAVRKGTSEVELKWRDRSNNEQSFIPQRMGFPFQQWTSLTTLGPNTEKYLDTNVPPGSYFYRVTACSAGGCSSSNIVFVVL